MTSAVAGSGFHIVRPKASCIWASSCSCATLSPFNISSILSLRCRSPASSSGMDSSTAMSGWIEAGGWHGFLGVSGKLRSRTEKLSEFDFLEVSEATEALQAFLISANRGTRTSTCANLFLVCRPRGSWDWAGDWGSLNGESVTKVRAALRIWRAENALELRSFSYSVYREHRWRIYRVSDLTPTGVFGRRGSRM